MTRSAHERRRQAARRWQEVERERPDLESAVRLQQVQVTFPVDVLSASLLAFCSDLADAGAGNAARRVREVLERGRIDAAALLRASLDRRTVAIRKAATQQGLSPDLLWLIAELAAGPVAYVLQRHVCADLDALSDQPAELLARWDRGSCPACGSWPAFAERRAGTAWLRCSFCGAAWRLQTERCVYGSDTGGTVITAASDLARPRRIQLCGVCGGYHRPSRPEAPEGDDSSIVQCRGAQPSHPQGAVMGGRTAPSS